MCHTGVRTAITYLRDYQEGGIEKLKEINFYRPKSDLESQRETLKKYFEKNPPATINEAVYRIEKLTGIKRSTGASFNLTTPIVGLIPELALHLVISVPS
ncbi:hypothetical protein MiAbW_03018 [Microcystis aeruginosa NIES-4325]|uniref:Uncharacterized protein n=1 Tax=Microcystis aeruginosa NIES-4325 TaxID=2569534 RepID=A0A5J4FBQ5_MICAE|nr:hypothetical protein MiAbW_03018 [Microcystis aeruginosa NIES-4325]